MFSHMEVFDVTPTLDTAIYADLDVLFNATEVPDVFMGAVECALFSSLQVNDEDDQGQPFELFLLNANQNLGTINAAASIADIAARVIYGPFVVGAGDYYDLTGVKVANPDFTPKIVKSAGQGARSLWVAGRSRGTGTYTASGLKLKLGFAY